MTESVVVIIQSMESAYTYDCVCEDCRAMFSLFGQLKPFGAEGDGASTIEQRVCEHLAQCQPNRTRITKTEILQNRKDPSVFRLTAEWTEPTS